MDNTLKRLGALALGMPGIAAAADLAVRPQLEVQTAFYEESDGRMQIASHSASYIAPLPDGKRDIQVNAVREIMSGASPEITIPGENGPIQLLSTASIVEKRSQLDLRLRQGLSSGNLAIHLGQSREDDYRANFANVGGSHDLLDKSLTFDWSVGLSDDEIDATNRPFGGDKNSRNILLGLTQIIDRSSLLQLNFNYARHDGYLDDPYKLVFVRDTGVFNDSRPETRDLFAGLLRYVRHMGSSDAALHLDYRYYLDSWEVDAHTLSARWHQPFGSGWQWIAGLRLYSQSAAEFHDPLPENNASGIWSSDYRLDAFGSASASMALKRRFTPDFAAKLSYETYWRRASWRAFGSSGFAGADYEFDQLALSIDWQF